ncbi:hypothetical protein EAF00_011258 [Botryotinia globosa]|nr:hypothetical protein EAF00_011258 [Botryotinia globosa]
MTETTISEEEDIKYTPVSKETKTTSSPARNVSVDKVTSSFTTPSSEASHEASRHIGSDTETGTRFPRYSPGAVEKPPRFLERNEHGYDIDIDSDFAMNIDVENNPYHDDDDDDDAYHYTYKPNPSPPHPPHPSHSPPPSQSSHIPRTPHSLHTPDLISFFPTLNNRDEHFNDYFKNIGFFENEITISRDPEPDYQSHDTSDSEASRRDERLEEEDDDDNKKQNSIPKNRGNKTTASCIRVHVDESSQQTSPILDIADLDEEYE